MLSHPPGPGKIALDLLPYYLIFLLIFLFCTNIGLFSTLSSKTKSKGDYTVRQSYEISSMDHLKTVIFRFLIEYHPSHYNAVIQFFILPFWGAFNLIFFKKIVQKMDF